MINEKKISCTFQDHDNIELTESDRKTLSKHFTELKTEMSIDTKQLSEQSQVKNLLATKAVLEKKLQKIQEDNRNLERTLNEERNLIDKLQAESEEIREEIRKFDDAQVKAADQEYDVINFVIVPLFSSSFLQNFKENPRIGCSK